MSDAQLFPEAEFEEADMADGNALAHREGPQALAELPTAATEAGSLMAVISRAASDPSVDVDKLERLMGLYERVKNRSAEQVYDEAMNAAQEDMRPIAADSNNPQTKSRYASFAALDRVLRPIYTKRGFSLSFDTEDGAPVDHIRIVCRVAHRDGHKERPHLDMPADGKGAKGGDVMTKTHATGAAITYGKRYLLGMIFNIAVGEDLDGTDSCGRDRGPAFEAAVAAVNACETLADLRDWKTKNAVGLDAMAAAEASDIIRLVNSRVAKLKGDAQ